MKSSIQHIRVSERLETAETHQVQDVGTREGHVGRREVAVQTRTDGGDYRAVGVGTPGGVFRIGREVLGGGAGLYAQCVCVWIKGEWKGRPGGYEFIAKKKRKKNREA